MSRQDASGQLAPVALDGLLVIDKPAGWTSHDVVARVRRLSGVRRIGHAGTLDPMATGVLPLGIGRATRLIEYLSDADKGYRATIRLGVRTDTDDADGSTLAERDWSHLTEEQVRVGLAGFVGEIDQIPPAYSAIKRDGVPLHRLARAGETVALTPRHVTIRGIEILEVALPDVTIDVACSKGTYIRSLARDLGEQLSCGAHLAALRRTRSGPFTLNDTTSLDELTEAAQAGRLGDRLLPPDAAVQSLPSIKLTSPDERLLLTGRHSPASHDKHPQGAVARAYGVDGSFVAIIRRTPQGWQPVKVFAEPAPAAGR
jgi:tRNA pseudouridine55 synthase